MAGEAITIRACWPSRGETDPLAKHRDLTAHHLPLTLQVPARRQYVVRACVRACVSASAQVGGFAQGYDTTPWTYRVHVISCAARYAQRKIIATALRMKLQPEFR